MIPGAPTARRSSAWRRCPRCRRGRGGRDATLVRRQAGARAVAVTGLGGPPRAHDRRGDGARAHRGRAGRARAAAELVASQRPSETTSPRAPRRAAAWRGAHVRALRGGDRARPTPAPIHRRAPGATPTLRLAAPLPNFTSGPARAHGQRPAAARRSGGTHDARGGAARGRTVERQGGLRRRPLRRVRGAARRTAGRVLPHARGARAGQERRHGRGPARLAERPASAAVRVRRGRRLALRLLRVRPRARRARAAGHGPGTDRGRRARCARGPVPLHRLLWLGRGRAGTAARSRP